MRKILLATTALFGLAIAGAAQAANSPLTVNVGGSVDFLAGLSHESKAATASAADARQSTAGDFETIYSLNFDVLGKAANGVQYGGKLTLDNAPDISDYFSGSNNSISVSQAYVFLSGAFGKIQLGDSHGATDLALTAPVVGEGQVYGRYMDFLGTTTFAKQFIAGIDNTDHSTNVTYFTPKVGNDNHKVQLGVSFEPSMYNYGSSVDLSKSPAATGNGDSSPYQNLIKGAAAYTGKFAPVTVGASAQILTATAQNGSANDGWFLNNHGEARSFTAWGLGAEAAYNGFTLGGNYLDWGHYNTIAGQTKDQNSYAVALKYEFSKVAVGVSYLGGEGYANTLTAASGGTNRYVKDFNSYGVGGSYTWTPGLSTNVDGVMFDQKSDSGVKNDGYVLLVSQKLAF